ncbi:hypothetical protein ACS0TY_013836 [Phlomoides rotata]
MTTRLKKHRKKRGHMSAGHGHIGKHRKHPRGRGNAGGMHHYRILFDKNHPGISERLVKDKASKDNAPLIDVTQFGYFKVTWLYFSLKYTHKGMCSCRKSIFTTK